MYALDAATGRRVWSRATPTTDNSQLVMADSAVVIADPDDGGVVALDAATGAQLWYKSTGPNSGVLGLVADGGAVFGGWGAQASGLTGGVTALSAAAGVVLWTAEFEPGGDTNGGLAVAAGTVYATTGNGEVYAYRAATGARLWRFHRRGVTFGGNASPLASGGVVYVCSDDKPQVLYAVRAATGDELWQQSLDAEDDASWLAVGDGVLFVGDSSNGGNAGYLAARDAATGGQLWKAPVTGGVFPLATADRVVYSGSNNGVLDAWQANTGNHLWSYAAAPGPVDNAIASNMVVADGVVYFGSNDHYVYAVAAR